MRGLPIRHLGGERLEYNCNGIFTWYASLLLVAALHFSGVWRLTSVFHNFGPLMTVAILTNDLFALALYVSALVRKVTVVFFF
jgi:delta24(24(1))-sterol reductase